MLLRKFVSYERFMEESKNNLTKRELEKLVKDRDKFRKSNKCIHMPDRSACRQSEALTALSTCFFYSKKQG